MKSKKSIDRIEKMIILTGGYLHEVLDLSAYDIEPADSGGTIIDIGLGPRRRKVIVHDNELPQKLWEESIVYINSQIFRDAVPNFDDTSLRAMFAKSRYAEYALNGNNDYVDNKSGKAYDSLALQLVARTMAISVDEVIYLLDQ